MQESATVEQRKGILETPLWTALNLDWEKVAYITLIVLALVLRLYGLGWRAMSHDESLHAQYSWQLYDGRGGYTHNPMMHGPYQFHITAVSFFLFGVNDATARLPAAISGVLAIGLIWFLRRWLGRKGALLAAVMMTISPLMLYYSRYIRNDMLDVLFVLITVWAIFRYLEEGQTRWLYLLAAALALNYTTKEVAFIYTGIFGLILLLRAIIEWVNNGVRGMFQSRSFDLIVLLGGLSAPLFAPFLIELLGRDPLVYGWFPFPQSGYLFSGSIFFVVLAASLAVGYWQMRQRFLVSVAIFYAITVPLFTTFFTNGRGLATGFIGSLGYWLAQQAVERGSQPEYYYFLMTPLYEFLPLILSMVAFVYLAVRWKTVAEVGEESRSSVSFVPFLALWVILSWITYTAAGEKMPWLIVHITLPMILLGGWLVGRLLDTIHWRALWRDGAHWLALILPVLFFSLEALLNSNPFVGRSIDQLSQTLQWIAALVVGAALIYFVLGYVLRLGLRATGQTVSLVLLVVFFLVTVRFSIMANFVNYDNVKEFLVYAQASGDIKIAMNQIEEISRRTVGDKQIEVAYDDDSTWPMEWYLREYPNKRFYGANPSRDNMSAPVIIVGDKNQAKAKPFLGDSYHEFRYRLIWWPTESYKGLTLDKITEGAKDVGARQNLWDIIWRRKYDYELTEWPHVHRFYLYVRKDVARQVWSYGAPAAASPVIIEEDPYIRGVRQVQSIRQIGFGQGSAPGQLDRPRNMAVDSQGSIYVADSGNHRIQVFGPDGEFIRQWGSVCKLYDEGQEGCQNLPDAEGQFNEPWGVAVDDEGYVYVSDTWNHRVQKFTSDGTFVTMWGTFATTGGDLTSPGTFWGPREVLVGQDGNIYVMDTGNKRVEKFAPDGTFIQQFGGAGVVEGRFDEPVGLAQDRDGNFYVADTWNMRVQKFDSNFDYLGQWPIRGWGSNSVVNKPYLTVDGENTVYVSDPEMFRILVFDTNGLFKATFGQYGSDAISFALPNGVTVGLEGNLYLADADNHRILIFPPIR